MKQIKFRGKALAGGGKWVYGNSLIQWGCNQYAIANNVIKDVEKHPTDVVNVNLFTGLYDKYGKEIYEGDILRSDNYPYSDGDTKDNYYTLVNADGPAFFATIMKSKKTKIRGISHGIGESIDREDFFSEFEVVGNIYDNKDLIEL